MKGVMLLSRDLLLKTQLALCDREMFAEVWTSIRKSSLRIVKAALNRYPRIPSPLLTPPNGCFLVE